MLHSGECERFPAVGDLQEGQRPLSFNRSVRERGRCVHAQRSVCNSSCWALREYYCQFPSLPGHEFPFSIQMSHVIPTRSPGGEGRDTAAPPVDRQVALQMEQLQVYKQCQFILKPRPTDTQNLPAGQFICRFFDLKSDHKSTLIVVFSELPQKPLKRRRSFIGWAFWRGSSSHLNDPSLSTPRGCLFGQPLGSVCIDGALPKPVMVS